MKLKTAVFAILAVGLVLLAVSACSPKPRTKNWDQETAIQKVTDHFKALQDELNKDKPDFDRIAGLYAEEIAIDAAETDGSARRHRGRSGAKEFWMRHKGMGKKEFVFTVEKVTVAPHVDPVKKTLDRVIYTVRFSYKINPTMDGTIEGGGLHWEDCSWSGPTQESYRGI